MKYTLYFFINLIIKEIRKLLVIFFLISLMYILIMGFNNIELSNNNFRALLGIPGFNEFTFLDFLWMLFQALFTIYVSTICLVYEEKNSIEYIILRKSFKNVIFNKAIFLIVIMIIFRMTLYFIYLFLFKNHFNFSYCIFFLNIMVHVILVYITFKYYLVKKYFSNDMKRYIK